MVCMQSGFAREGKSRFRRGVRLTFPGDRSPCYDLDVKISDDYRAKVKLWAHRPVVVSLPPGPLLPRFTARKFRTHEEMNRWKQTFLREIALAVARHG